jgi:hypothetical protein
MATSAGFVPSACSVARAAFWQTLSTIAASSSWAIVALLTESSPGRPFGTRRNRSSAAGVAPPAAAIGLPLGGHDASPSGRSR